MALRDRREQVLSRLKDLATGVSGIECVFRNAEDVPADSRPCFVIFDGEESASDKDLALGSKRKFGANVIEMSVEIAIKASGAEDDVDAFMNLKRLELLAAVYADAQIIAAVGDAGNIRYLGLTTRDEFGKALEGELKFRIEFSYLFIPGETA